MSYKERQRNWASSMLRRKGWRGNIFILVCCYLMGWDRGGGAEVHGDRERDSGYQMGVKQHSSGTHCPSLLISDECQCQCFCAFLAFCNWLFQKGVTVAMGHRLSTTAHCSVNAQWTWICRITRTYLLLKLRVPEGFEPLFFFFQWCFVTEQSSWSSMRLNG